MILIDAWKNVVLKNYANFEGRAGRAEFWWYVLANLIVLIVLAILGGISSVFTILYVVYVLAVLVPNIAVAMRRLHDTNKSGWLLLLGLVPLIGFIILLVFYILQSDAGSNAYGEPKPWPTASAS